MNGSASDMNLSPAAGWVGEESKGKGLGVFNAPYPNPTVCPKEPFTNIKGQGQK